MNPTSSPSKCLTRFLKLNSNLLQFFSLICLCCCGFSLTFKVGRKKRGAFFIISYMFKSNLISWYGYIIAIFNLVNGWNWLSLLGINCKTMKVLKLKDLHTQSSIFDRLKLITHTHTHTHTHTYIYDDAQKISRLKWFGLQWASDRLKGLKRKKHEIKGDRGESAKNSPMLKLVFPLELKNSNFRSSGNLLQFDVDESLYRKLWSGYLFSNFPNICGN